MIFSKRCALSRCTLALELVTLLIIVVPSCESVGGLTGSSAYVEKDPSFLHLRPRLGYFPNVKGYLEIYQDYVDKILKPNDSKFQYLSINDWRMVRPESQLCVDFLQGFQVDNYKINKPYEIILVDACVFWLYDTSDEKKTDMSSLTRAGKEEVKQIKKDSKLKEIYESTMFKDDKIPDELKEKIHSYLTKLMKIYNDNPRNGCHSLWLQAYNDFIEDDYIGECEDEDTCLFFDVEGADKDSYLNLIVESTKEASKYCFDVMQKQMNGLMHRAYDDETMTGLYTKIKSATSKVAKQSTRNRWSREMIRILQLITQTDPDYPIDLVKVSDVLMNLKKNDEEEVKRFTKSISEYAMAKVNLKDTVNDPQGRIRFGKALTKLCRPYIDPQEFLSRTGGSSLWEDEPGARKPFEFYPIIYSLVRITNHEAIFMVTKQKFEEDVLKNDWVALYLATFACQMISTTWGRLDYDTNDAQYTVVLRPNARVLIEDWPIELIENELHSKPDEHESDNEPEAVDPEPEVRSNPAPQTSVQPLSAPVMAAPPRAVAVAPPPVPIVQPQAVVVAPSASPTVKQIQKQDSTAASADKNGSATAAFRNPFKRHKEPTKVETPKMAPLVEEPSVPAPISAPPAPSPAPRSKPMADLNLHPIDDGEEMPDNGLSASTNAMYKALHGHYPKRDKPAASTVKEAPKKETPSAVPLAFNFDASYSSGEPVVKKAPVDKWAGLNAMSF